MIVDTREFEGKTIDEAIDEARHAFGVPRTKLNIDILSEASTGFLGLGAKKARIRASLLQIDLDLNDLLDGPSLAAEKKAARPAAESPAALPTPREERKAPPPQPERDAPSSAAARHPLPAAHEPADGEESAAKAKRILEGLLAHMRIESPVGAEEKEETIILNIQGDGSGLLIGKRGQNLDAIQYFVNKAIHHTANGRKMIVIDTEGYRKRREESLIALAAQTGEKVKKTRKPATMGHMNAHDRRIVHLALQNDNALATRSRGEGEYRSILVLPARREAEETDD